MESVRCRLCACETLMMMSIEDELRQQIFTLFHVRIGGPEDRLPSLICEPCLQTVHNTWLFLVKVQRAQQELIDTLNSQPVIQVGKNEDGMVECVMNDVDISAEEFLDDIVDEDKEQSDKKMKVTKLKEKEYDCRNDSDVLSGASDCEYNCDGSIVPRKNLQGWDTYPWICCECGYTGRNAEELRDHYSKSHGQINRYSYSCADCPKVYSKYTMFVTHVRVHRPQLRFCCDTCNKWFPSSKIQERHRAAHGDERPHACKTCGKRFRLHSALLVHSRSHLPAELKNRHQCDICPKRFGTRPNLMAHKRIHAGVRDYTCDQCGKSFVQKGNLENHLLTHTAARPFSCTTCGKSFKTLIRLRKHGTVHSGLKPHRCDVCGRQFRERSTLKEHHRIHTGAMPFTCEFCGKSFRFKGVLTTHRRQHTGERPYSCLECQHHFTNWPNYNKHMKRRHGINTSVTVRKPQVIPPTGMPQRNPPGSVLAPPQLPATAAEPQHHYATQPSAAAVTAPDSTAFYPVINMYNITDDLMQQQQQQQPQQRTVQ